MFFEEVVVVVDITVIVIVIITTTIVVVVVVAVVVVVVVVVVLVVLIYAFRLIDRDYLPFVLFLNLYRHSSANRRRINMHSFDQEIVMGTFLHYCSRRDSGYVSHSTAQ